MERVQADMEACLLIAPTVATGSWKCMRSSSSLHSVHGSFSGDRVFRRGRCFLGARNASPLFSRE